MCVCVYAAKVVLFVVPKNVAFLLVVSRVAFYSTCSCSCRFWVQHKLTSNDDETGKTPEIPDYGFSEREREKKTIPGKPWQQQKKPSPRGFTSHFLTQIMDLTFRISFDTRALAINKRPSTKRYSLKNLPTYYKWFACCASAWWKYSLC